MTSEQSSVNGDWYSFYGSLGDAGSENCYYLPSEYIEPCLLFCLLDLHSISFGEYHVVECPKF